MGFRKIIFYLDKDRSKMQSMLKTTWVMMQDTLCGRLPNYEIIGPGVGLEAPQVYKTAVPLNHEFGRFRYYETLFNELNEAIESDGSVSLENISISMRHAFKFDSRSAPGTKQLQLEEKQEGN